MTSSPIRAARHGTGNNNNSTNSTTTSSNQHQQMGSASFGYRDSRTGGETSTGGRGGHAQESEFGHGRGDDHDIDVDDQDDAEMDDGNSSLIAQTLNADGTPKRPMNAFMIFARRRRPQVSAANQMMRTGEISKILSREWSGMPTSEKQFYLDQAKKLKDAFNNKYPDYVYRRRPNNSRRRRRADSGSTGGSVPGAIRATGSGGPLSASDQSEQELEVHDRDDHGSFDAGSPVDYRPGSGSAGPGGGGGLGGHLGYSDIVVHPATNPSGPTGGTLPLGLSSLSPLGGPGPGAGTSGGLVPPSGAYPRAPFTPLSASTSSGTSASGAAGSDHGPVSPLSPYARYSPYSPVTPATSAGSGFAPGSYGTSSSTHSSYPDSDFGHSAANGTGGNAPGSATHPPHRLSLDWPPDPPHHSTAGHSAYPHSPADPSPHATSLWASRASGSGSAGSVPSSWALPGLGPPTGLPPPGGGPGARARFGSAGGPGSGGLGLSLSLGQGGQSQNQNQNQGQGRAREYKELFNPLPPPTSGQGGGNSMSGLGPGAVSAAAARRERAWSTTPSNASASPSAGGGGAQFPTLTEPFHPSSHNRAGSSSGSSPSVGFSRSAGGDIGDIYDTPGSGQGGGPHSAYPISPLSPYPGAHSSQSQGHGGGHQQQQQQQQQHGRPTLLHPIATFGTGGGNVSPRDVSPLSAVSPHSGHPSGGGTGGGGGYWGDRLSDR